MQKQIESRNNPQKEQTVDLVVIGGGLSGVCCAVTAARKGMKVALVQDRPVLGGNASSEVRVWALGATSHMGNNNRWAREGGLIDEIMVENLHRNKEGNPILFDALLLDKVLAEPTLTLYLNTTVSGVEKSSADTLTSVIAFNSQNSTSYRLSAQLFCDASGDGIVSYLAGASFRVGAEDADEFGEGFSPSEEYGRLLGHTLFLYPKMTDRPVKYVMPDFASKETKEIPKLHLITPDQSGCNYWWFEYGGTKDTIADSEEIKMELWKVVHRAWDHIKNSGRYPEAECMTLEWVGTIPGKRESRRIEGLYMLTQHDIIKQTIFADAVSYGGWAIDLHPAEGVYSSLPSCNQYHAKGIYSIPYRCFVSKEIGNLFVAGRLLSVSHVAFGSTRVMITCAHGGQAVGVSAALCTQRNCLPKDLLQPDAMHQLQQELSIDGQSIPHVAIDADTNLASSARITATGTMQFQGFPFDGGWQRLDFSHGQLLPLQPHVCYTVTVQVKVEEATELETKAATGQMEAATELEVDLCVSSKVCNYTPDVVLQRRSYTLKPGEQELSIRFDECLSEKQYAFLIFRRNEKVALRATTCRVTGILSVCNKFNKAVNNLGRQQPPHGSGFESFEFFTPERRPGGGNIAMTLSPALPCFEPGVVTNGFVRPYLAPNAWVADWEDASPELHLEWEEEQEIHSIWLYFDTDFDHPMETIQWNHPESQMPYCVQNYRIYNDKGELLYTKTENHQTINKINLPKSCHTHALKIVLEQNPAIPVALFEIEIR